MTLQNRMLEIRKGQQGQEEQLTDKEIVAQVLGTKWGFNPGRGRVLAGSSSSSSSVRSHPAPAPQMTQSQISSLARYVMNLHAQLADRKVIDLPPPPSLTPHCLWMLMKKRMQTSPQVSKSRPLWCWPIYSYVVFDNLCLWPLSDMFTNFVYVLLIKIKIYDQ